MQYQTQWLSLWAKLGSKHCPLEPLVELLQHYREPHRKYHTLQHLSECFEQLTHIRNQIASPEEVELAIWFHDAIYDVKRHDNEERSAQWAKTVVLESGLSETIAQRVYDLVIATGHDTIPITEQAKILVDIDLSILGSPTERFEQYEQQIREEYHWVPKITFIQKRLQILESFKLRSPLFATAYFQKTHEEQAQSNLQRSIQRYLVS